jgi:hypothetical protein
MFKMGSEPSKQFGAEEGAAPPSLTSLIAADKRLVLRQFRQPMVEQNWLLTSEPYLLSTSI